MCVVLASSGGKLKCPIANAGMSFTLVSVSVLRCCGLCWCIVFVC